MTKSAYVKNLGGWIRRERRALELRQAELARAIGVSESSVSRWESGASSPDAYTHALVRAYFRQRREMKGQ